MRFFAFVVTLHQIISFRAFQQKNFPYCKRQCNINVRVTTTPPKPSRKFSMNKSCHVKKQCKTPTLNDCRNCIAKLISNVNEMLVMGSRCDHPNWGNSGHCLSVDRNFRFLVTKRSERSERKILIPHKTFH